MGVSRKKSSALIEVWRGLEKNMGRSGDESGEVWSQVCEGLERSTGRSGDKSGEAWIKIWEGLKRSLWRSGDNSGRHEKYEKVWEGE